MRNAFWRRKGLYHTYTCGHVASPFWKNRVNKQRWKYWTVMNFPIQSNVEWCTVQKKKFQSPRMKHKKFLARNCDLSCRIIDVSVTGEKSERHGQRQCMNSNYGSSRIKVHRERAANHTRTQRIWINISVWSYEWAMKETKKKPKTKWTTEKRSTHTHTRCAQNSGERIRRRRVKKRRSEHSKTNTVDLVKSDDRHIHTRTPTKWRAQINIGFWAAENKNVPVYRALASRPMLLTYFFPLRSCSVRGASTETKRIHNYTCVVWMRWSVCAPETQWVPYVRARFFIPHKWLARSHSPRSSILHTYISSSATTFDILIWCALVFPLNRSHCCISSPKKQQYTHREKLTQSYLSPYSRAITISLHRRIVGLFGVCVHVVKAFE